MVKFLADCSEYVRGHRTDEALGRRIREVLPSGSGFDNGTTLLYGECELDKLVFQTCFHHMNCDGVYTHWTHHKVIFTPSFRDGYNIRVTGVNYEGIKGHIEDVFGFFIREYENAR